jgi:hypothetical protein
VRLYNRDITNKLSQVREQVKISSITSDSVVKQESPKNIELERSSRPDYREPAVSKSSLVSETRDHPLTKSAGR